MLYLIGIFFTVGLRRSLRSTRSERDTNPRYDFSVHPSDRLLAPPFQLSQHRF